MLRKIYAISNVEFKNLYRSYIFLVALIIIVAVPLVVDSPLMDGHLWTVKSASYNFAHGTCTMSIFFIPLLAASLFYFEDKRDNLKIVFSNPTRKGHYISGKFGGGMLFYLFIIGIGYIVNIFVPIVLGSKPYNPIAYFDSIIVYILPAVIFYLILCILINVIFRSYIFSIILPIMYTFIVDKMDNILSLRISEERLATLSNGGKIPQEMMEFLILNRSFLIGLGAVLLGASAFLFNKKNYIRGR